MKTRLVAAAATTGFAVSALLAGTPAGAQAEPLPLTIDPASGTDGVFTVSGTGCVAETGPGAVIIEVAGAPLENADPASPLIANEDGTWSLGVEPVGGLPDPGTIEVTAECNVNDGAATPTPIVTYAPASYELLPTETPDPTAPPATDPPAPVAPDEVILQAPAPAQPVAADPDYTG
jgi:hypothetical protein